jgi:FtsZ-interacting cell division protein ZipA
MEKNEIIILVLVGIAVVVLIVFLIWKKQKDKKLVDPDAPDAVEETQMEQERRRNKI